MQRYDYRFALVDADAYLLIAFVARIVGLRSKGEAGVASLCLAPNEMIGEDIGCVTGTYVTIINAQTATGIKNIKKEGDKVNYRLQGNVLKVYTSAMLYSLEGKLICGLKGEQQIDTSVLPDGFILKFEDGTVCKLLK